MAIQFEFLNQMPFGGPHDGIIRPQDAGRFPELIGEGVVFAVYAVAGRIVLRLRLSPASRSEGRPILLGLHREAKPVLS
jgi:hypothetical protein